MKNTTQLKYKKYTGSIEISLEDNCLHGRILFINDLITYGGNTLNELKSNFKNAVDRYIKYCDTNDKNIKCIKSYYENGYEVIPLGRYINK